MTWPAVAQLFSRLTPATARRPSSGSGSERSTFPCYWYKLDRNDRDWSLHISYLIETIKQRHPDFGRRARSMLEQLGGPGSSRPGVAAYLLAEMYERLTEPCTFISMTGSSCRQ